MDKRQRKKLEKKRINKKQNLNIHEKELFKMIKTKRIRLDWFDCFNHYALPLLFPIMNLYHGVKKMIVLKEFNLNFIFLDYFSLFFTGLFLFAVYKKYNMLQFKTVQTDMSIETLHRIIKETGRELDWRVSLDNFGGGGVTDASFWKASFGENIIILLDRENNQVLVNSVFEYYEKGSIFSLSGNRKNEQRLIKKITEYEAKKS
ncbi:hypothetical protein ACE193_12660 [Bernardetia sp. OM2101]|uniref:hypothetical protein n=1 Tax=Bernardetia sp. OM2101 TaxID=3344876 RepID=UPI0035CFFF3F